MPKPIFWEKLRKNIVNLSSAEFSHRVVNAAKLFRNSYALKFIRDMATFKCVPACLCVQARARNHIPYLFQLLIQTSLRKLWRLLIVYIFYYSFGSILYTLTLKRQAKFVADDIYFYFSKKKKKKKKIKMSSAAVVIGALRVLVQIYGKYGKGVMMS